MARRIYCGNQERIRPFSLVLNNISTLVSYEPFISVS